MARLIDADALRSEMYHEAFETDSVLQKWESGCWIRWKLFENHLNNAPTVASVPVVHGRWMKNKYGYITCSNCNCFPLETMTGSLMTMHYEPCESEYCPHCGAKMDAERDDECADCERDCTMCGARFEKED